MKALQFYGKGNATVEDVPQPVPGQGEALIRVMVSAICGSERKSYQEGCTYISGHEYCGEVVETNACSLLKSGDRVAVNVIRGCGICYFCQTGTPQLCGSIKTLHGGHAEYATVPEECCILLPP